MNSRFTESIVEEAALSWFEGMGYSVLNGPNIAPGELFAERASYSDVILEGRLHSAFSRINPSIPHEALDDAYRKLTRAIHESPLLYANNHNFHKMLTEGIDVEYKDETGRIVGDKVWLLDYDNPDNNDWLTVNQFTVVEGQNNRRPDVVVFLNGLPLGIIELKNPVDENATIKDAFNQFQTYKNEILSLFPYNEILVASDGIEARAGTLTAMLYGFDYSKYFTGTPSEKLTVIKEVMEHILTLDDGKNRFMQAVTELSKAFALSVPHEKALAIRTMSGFSRQFVQHSLKIP